MQFYSTNNKNLNSHLKNAVLQGLAPDNGLYMPEHIPVMPEEFWEQLPKLSLGEIGFETLKHFFCPDIPEEVFRQITDEAFNFPIPVVPVSEDISALELFHGPTLAFKDIGARFLARVMSQFTEKGGKPINVLVATSGDTGSAVANGFLGVDGVNVIVLYPKGLVSEVQEKQFTTLGQNIQALEVKGTFDDCQRLVKTAFMDEALRQKLVLTSANSINLARFLPQMVYYFYAFGQIKRQDWKDTVICVPSGNFGNLTAGMIAAQMGLPVKRFVAATNVNDIVPQYLETGNYKPAPSIATPANAMDVGDPSNFVRIQTIFDNNLNKIQDRLTGLSVSDTQIKETIRIVFEKHRYVLDPHGAVGFRALQKNLKKDEKGIFLATAHPAKFPETVELETQQKVQQPPRLERFMHGTKRTTALSKNYSDLKCFLETASVLKT